MAEKIDQRPVIIMGGGAHAKVVLDMLRLRNVPVLGYTDPQGPAAELSRFGVTCLGNDQAVLDHDRETVRLTVGVGGIGDTAPRWFLFESLLVKDYVFVSVVHPSAVVARGVKVGDGAQIMAGAVVNPGSRVGDNAIVNTGAVLDHDVFIGDHAHVAPGATLSGGVIVGDGSHVGAGAVVIQGVAIGPRALVAAGATVIRDVPAGGRVAGTPARPMTA